MKNEKLQVSHRLPVVSPENVYDPKEDQDLIRVYVPGRTQPIDLYAYSWAVDAGAEDEYPDGSLVLYEDRENHECAVFAPGCWVSVSIVVPYNRIRAAD